MNYQGRELDAVSLWGSIVSFPEGMSEHGFSALVVCPNPTHYTDKRHFQVNLARPLVHCFANCGISGTYEHALSLVLGVTPKESKRKILEHCRIQIGATSKRKMRDGTGRVKRINANTDKEISLEYDTYLPAIAAGYLEARGINAESIARWGIGWDSGERRIVIPGHDERGTLRFLIRRAINPKDWPKYLYSEGFPKTSLLFGACHLDLERVGSDGLVLVEGSIDTIRQHQDDARNTAGILGSGISDRQVEIIYRLRPPRVTMMFDKDVAGFHAMQSVEQRLTKVPLFTCLYPRDKSDPAELTKEERTRITENAIPFVKFKQRLPKTITRNAYARR